MPGFELVTDYRPQGDQPRAIAELVEGVLRGDPHQTLLGVTGSGKTFTMANVVVQLQRPTLVIAHNKTLAAQLYGEFKELFPRNAVEYFISYYDYYQPEAYIPSSDTYIEKDSFINDEIERMRHSATHSLRTRDDVIIVASVSCIYGLGTARSYMALAATAQKGVELGRDVLMRRLVDAQYERNDIDFHRGTFRVRGDTIEVFPAYEEERAVRIEFFGDTVERITEFDPLRGQSIAAVEKIVIFPASHYVTRRSSGPGRSATSATSSGSACSGSARTGSFSRHSGWRSARSTTSRCSSRSGSATASRTTAATSPAAPPVSRRPVSSTTTRRTSW